MVLDDYGGQMVSLVKCFAKFLDIRLKNNLQEIHKNSVRNIKINYC